MASKLMCWGHNEEVMQIWSYLGQFLVFQDKVSLCGIGFPGISFVDKAGFELTELCLLLPPE